MPRIHNGHKYFKSEYTYHCSVLTGQIYNKDVIAEFIHKAMQFSIQDRYMPYD